MISYVLPTRDRAAELAETLAQLGSLSEHTGAGGVGRPGEVIIVDNASADRPEVPGELANGLQVRLIELDENRGAAARNEGVRLASADSEWVVMLDDDSAPRSGEFLDRLDAAPGDIAAITADIVLPDGSRERGGLPEVPIGCGVAYRRWAFLAADGYDQAFHYYVEEYDLAAKLIRAGKRISFEPAFQILHRKSASQRDMNVILQRLVRNNGWVMQRYAPDDQLDARLNEIRTRYREIAEREGALAGFDAGLDELNASLSEQTRTPMTRGEWERFVGLAAARAGIRRAQGQTPIATARIVARGKNDWAVEQAARECGIEIVEGDADAILIGTLSPGPMLDAAAALKDCDRPVILPELIGRPGSFEASCDRPGDRHAA